MSDAVPVGICVFVTPPMSLGPRNTFFGRKGRWTSLTLKAMNRQLLLLQRVVLHPTYRGAGVASRFVRRSCELCPSPWIETLSQLGRIHPLFERAGFIKVGPVHKAGRQTRQGHAAVFGHSEKRGNTKLISEETFRKSRFSRPLYYVFDNRANFNVKHSTQQ